MKMSYDGALVMPNNCSTMSSEEMSYLDGGYSLGMSKSYLNKQACLNIAVGFVRDRKWSNVTAEQLAHEIFGHAVVHYHWPQFIQNINYKGATIYDHCKSVDIKNEVDPYQKYFDTIWKVCNSEGSFHA